MDGCVARLYGSVSFLALLGDFAMLTNKNIVVG